MQLIGGSGGFCCDDHATVIDCRGHFECACPVIGANVTIAPENDRQIKLQLLPQPHCLTAEYLAHLNSELSADSLEDLAEVMEECLEVLVFVVDGLASDEDATFNN